MVWDVVARVEVRTLELQKMRQAQRIGPQRVPAKTSVPEVNRQMLDVQVEEFRHHRGTFRPPEKQQVRRRHRHP